MKKVIIILTLALGIYTEYSFAEKTKATEPNLIAKVDKSNGGSKTVSSQDVDDNSDNETNDDNNANTNAANSVDALVKQQDSIDNANDNQNTQGNNGVDDFANILKNSTKGSINAYTVATAAIIAPIILIFLVLLLIFLYKYKSKKAKYHIAEEALKAGQPVPEGLFNKDESVKTRTVYTTTQDGKRVKHIEMTSNSLKEKGIRNICLGVGLFIFLWALTDTFGLGCIGLLIACTGIGQYIIARNRSLDEINNFIDHPEENLRRKNTQQEEQTTEATSEDKKDETIE